MKLEERVEILKSRVKLEPLPENLIVGLDAAWKKYGYGPIRQYIDAVFSAGRMGELLDGAYTSGRMGSVLDWAYTSGRMGCALEFARDGNKSGVWDGGGVEK